MKYRTILALALSGSFAANAALLEVGNGIEISIINGEKVKDISSYELVKGQNQLAIQFSGSLNKSGKREHFSTVPYLVVIDVKEDDLNVELVSKKYNVIDKKVSSAQPIFQFTADNESLNSEQIILPPADSFLPYGNIQELVTTYNNERGLVFDSGKIRELKKELASVSENSKLENKESENSLQLKLWYSRANQEERKAFQKWVIDHN
ncbi:DUF2057 family protein [Aliivibrio fischeri]|uniref:DUF2057 family protein n=1 Tax=Aliivibrio fischeri TaxID=668 RepID=UPI0037356B3A